MNNPSQDEQDAQRDRTGQKISEQETFGPNAKQRKAILDEAARSAERIRAAGSRQSARTRRLIERTQYAANDSSWRTKSVAAIVVLGLIGVVAMQASRKGVLNFDQPATPSMAAEVSTQAAQSGVIAERASQPEPATPPGVVARVPAEALRGTGQPPPSTSAGIVPRQDAKSAAARSESTETAVETDKSTAGAAATSGAAPEPTAESGEEEWAARTRALLQTLVSRRGLSVAEVRITCSANQCELQGEPAQLQDVLSASELEGRLAVAGSGPAPGAAEGVVRYTLARLPSP